MKGLKKKRRLLALVMGLLLFCTVPVFAENQSNKIPDTVKAEEVSVETAPGETSGAESSTDGTDEILNTEGDPENGSGNGETADTAAKIGETDYITLDAAIKAAKETDIIELLRDCELTTVKIDKPIVIQGNGKTIDVEAPDVPEIQEENLGALILNSSLTLKNTVMEFDNASHWALIMGPDVGADASILNLSDGSVCHFVNYGLYAGSHAKINVDASTLQLDDTGYTAMMGVQYPTLNLTNGAKLLIDGKGYNGINNFLTVVDNSTVDVSHSMQGMVGGSLVLENHSVAHFDNNNTGINTFGRNDKTTNGFVSCQIVVNAGTTLTLSRNAYTGLILQGKADFIVRKGGIFEATGNGCAEDIADCSEYWASTVDIGGWSENSSYNYSSSSVNFEDGANVRIVDNNIRGLAVSTSSESANPSYIGKGTVITGNNTYQYGGGILNFNALTVHPDVELHNNHAAIAGDDIYNKEDDKTITKNHASIAFGETGAGWVLDGKPNHCAHAIDGWYEDGLNGERWEAHDQPFHVEKIRGGGAITGAVALKAAHGLIPVDPDDPEAPEWEIPKSKTATQLDGNTPPADDPSIDAPQTGDSSNMVLWLVLAGVSALGILATLLGRKHLFRRK